MLYFTQICGARYHFLRRTGAHEGVFGALAQADFKVLAQTANISSFPYARYIWDWPIHDLKTTKRWTSLRQGFDVTWKMYTNNYNSSTHSTRASLTNIKSVHYHRKVKYLSLYERDVSFLLYCYAGTFVSVVIDWFVLLLAICLFICLFGPSCYLVYQFKILLLLTQIKKRNFLRNL